VCVCSEGFTFVQSTLVEEDYNTTSKAPQKEIYSRKS